MSLGIAYSGKLYRALNPVWSADPLSGQGAALHGGRFNPKGTIALYCSLSPHTALKEAHQAGDLQPTMLLAYQAAIEGLFDAREATALAAFGMTPAGLADTGWRDAARNGALAPTQAFALQLAAKGHPGMFVPSYARGATDEDVNLVLWRWGKRGPSRLLPIDDENRLARPR